MINNFKIFVIMLGLISMFTPSLSAMPTKSVQPNILTIAQTDDEEIEGEEGDWDEYYDDVYEDTNVKKTTTNSVEDIITWVLLGIILIAFLYAFYWLRHNNVTLENHPIIYTSLKVSKFSAIIGFIACLTFMVCTFIIHLSDQTVYLIIGGFGVIILIYAIYKSIKSYSVLDSVTTKVLVTIVSIALSLLIGYSLLYLGLGLVAFYVLWYAIKDKLGFDNYTLSDGTMIKRTNSLSSRYKDADGNTYERTSDGDFIKL